MGVLFWAIFGVYKFVIQSLFFRSPWPVGNSRSTSDTPGWTTWNASHCSSPRGRSAPSWTPRAAWDSGSSKVWSPTTWDATRHATALRSASPRVYWTPTQDGRTTLFTGSQASWLQRPSCTTPGSWSSSSQPRWRPCRYGHLQPNFSSYLPLHRLFFCPPF